MGTPGPKDFLRRRRAVAITASAVALAVMLAAPGARAQSGACAGFRVLHADRVGRATLPPGTYSIEPSGISCAAASQRFTQFLEDWNGKLGGGWRVSSSGSGKATFARAGQRFSVTRGGATGGGSGGSTRGVGCPTAVSIPVRDRIGPLVIPAGNYRIVRLSSTAPSCSQAGALLSGFLLDFDGRLSGGWVLVPNEAGFVNGSLWNGFRIQPWGGDRNRTRPAKTGVTRCPASFRVLNDDRIGPLRYPKGNYYLSLLKGSNGLSCPQASKQFSDFLSDPNGNLPPPWVLNARTGSFRRGAGSSTGFVAKPAFKVR